MKGSKVTPESDIDAMLYNSMIRSTAQRLQERDSHVEDAIRDQTRALSAAYRKAKPVVNNTIRIDMGWGTYIHNNVKN